MTCPNQHRAKISTQIPGLQDSCFIAPCGTTPQTQELEKPLGQYSRLRHPPKPSYPAPDPAPQLSTSLLQAQTAHTPSPRTHPRPQLLPWPLLPWAGHGLATLCSTAAWPPSLTLRSSLGSPAQGPSPSHPSDTVQRPSLLDWALPEGGDFYFSTSPSVETGI